MNYRHLFHAGYFADVFKILEAQGASVVHFQVTGKDGAKLRDFYGKVFGWQFNVMPEMDYGLVDNGGRGINGGIGSGPSDGSAKFYVEVADPQATLDEAEKLGGKIIRQFGQRVHVP